MEEIRYFLITRQIWAPNKISIFFFILLKARLDKSYFFSCQNTYLLFVSTVCLSQSRKHVHQATTACFAPAVYQRNSLSAYWDQVHSCCLVSWAQRHQDWVHVHWFPIHYDSHLPSGDIACLCPALAHSYHCPISPLGTRLLAKLAIGLAFKFPPQIICNIPSPSALPLLRSRLCSVGSGCITLFMLTQGE